MDPGAAPGASKRRTPDALTPIALNSGAARESDARDARSTWAQQANALILQWHLGVITVEYEAFQLWALASLKAALPFDSAIWGVLAQTEANAGLELVSVKLHHVSGALIEQGEAVRSSDTDSSEIPAPSRHLLGFEYRGDLEHSAHHYARKFGLRHVRVATFDSTIFPRRQFVQFVVLARASDGARFKAPESAQFDQLAPHLMQAYALRRRLFVTSPPSHDRLDKGLSVALLGPGGAVLEQDGQLVAMLRREWGGWDSGAQLPAPLLELLARPCGARQSYMGDHICAELSPVADCTLMTLRPRSSADALTAREADIARRYADGANFRQIAATLNVSPPTVRSHLRNIFGKLQVRDRTQLASSLR